MPATRQPTRALLALGLPLPAYAAAGEVLSAARIGQTLAGLVAIVACIFALAYLARRVPGLATRAGSALKLVDALSVGTRERILLIEVDGQRIVLAATPGRIERLHVCAAPHACADSFAVALADAGADAGRTP